LTTKGDEWPEEGEIVISTVENITRYGVYLRLDEYDKEGFLHISEISSSWVKNIRNHLREKQKVALKVLRVDPERNQVDVSLRRVTKRERREKNISWKRRKKTESLLRSLSEKTGISLEGIQERVGSPLEETFGDIYEGLEKAVKQGGEVLTKAGVSPDLVNIVTETAKERITLERYKVKGILNLTNTQPNGVQRIKQALLKAQKIEKPNNSEIFIYVITPPKYRIEAAAESYKAADGLLLKATTVALEDIKKSGGQGKFEKG
jgi:translation initiation factor 2 subunit 1